MAAAQLNRTRREVLGAAVALPLAAAAGPATAASLAGHGLGGGGPPACHDPNGPTRAKPGHDPRTVTSWNRALAAYGAAEREFTVFERWSQGRPDEEQRGLEDGYGDRMDAMYAALRRLLRVPAPDLPALLRKIVLVADHEVGTLTGGEACIAAMKRDALRFARDAAPRPAHA